jgi:hypothetical protein
MYFLKITSPMKSDRLFLKQIKTFSVRVLSDLKILGFACLPANQAFPNWKTGWTMRSFF